jgi:hypothetical protein
MLGITNNQNTLLGRGNLRGFQLHCYCQVRIKNSVLYYSQFITFIVSISLQSDTNQQSCFCIMNYIIIGSRNDVSELHSSHYFVNNLEINSKSEV